MDADERAWFLDFMQREALAGSESARLVLTIMAAVEQRAEQAEQQAARYRAALESMALGCQHEHWYPIGSRECAVCVVVGVFVGQARAALAGGDDE